MERQKEVAGKEKIPREVHGISTGIREAPPTDLLILFGLEYAQWIETLEPHEEEII